MKKERPSGIILSGGRSSRFGTNKALARLGGKPLIAHVLDSILPAVSSVIVVTKDPQTYRFLERRGVRLAKDRGRGMHPLVGLKTGLELSPAGRSFVCAADMPFLQPALLDALLRSSNGWDAVVARWKGVPQPLCGLYSKRCLEALSRPGKEDSLRGLLGRVRTRFLDEEEVRTADPQGLSFIDLDTRADYQRARDLEHLLHDA